VSVGETCTIRARPRTGPDTEVACVSRIHTPALFEFPLPLSIASRPVASMAETIADGAAVPSMKTNCSCKFASTLVMPETLLARGLNCVLNTPHRPLSLVKAPDTSLTHESQCSGTANVVCQLSNGVVMLGVVDSYLERFNSSATHIGESNFQADGFYSITAVTTKRPQHDSTRSMSNREGIDMFWDSTSSENGLLKSSSPFGEDTVPSPKHVTT
jgi:hypothetical protein